MSTHHLCKSNCGGTGCDAPRRIEAARQAQPLDELERKAKKATRRGFWVQEQIDWARAWARDFKKRVRVE